MQKAANGTTTVYIYSGSKDIAEYDNGASPSSPSREYIYGNNQLLAMVSGSTTTYYQSDHLSVRMTTDSNGNVLGQQGSFPFGESWYSSNGSSEWTFTTYQHDNETGLEYALARYYDTRTGGFCSADPVEGDPSDPQSWNRYAYARDNPISITDPSGQFSLFDIFKLIGLISMDILTSGATTEETLPSLIGEFEGWSSFAEMTNIMSHEGQQSGQHPQLPPPLRLPPQTTNKSHKPKGGTKNCIENAHGVYNNLPTIHPSRKGAYGVPETQGTAAIDRSQFLPPGSSMTGQQANAYINKYRSQISGYVPNGNGGYDLLP